MFLGNNFCSAHLELLQSPNQTRLVQHIERGILYYMKNRKNRNEQDHNSVKHSEIYRRVRQGNIVFIYSRRIWNFRRDRYRKIMIVFSMPNPLISQLKGYLFQMSDLKEEITKSAFFRPYQCPYIFFRVLKYKKGKRNLELDKTTFPLLEL